MKPLTSLTNQSMPKCFFRISIIWSEIPNKVALQEDCLPINVEREASTQVFLSYRSLVLFSKTFLLAGKYNIDALQSVADWRNSQDSSRHESVYNGNTASYVSKNSPELQVTLSNYQWSAMKWCGLFVLTILETGEIYKRVGLPLLVLEAGCIWKMCNFNGPVLMPSRL